MITSSCRPRNLDLLSCRQQRMTTNFSQEGVRGVGIRPVNLGFNSCVGRNCILNNSSVVYERFDKVNFLIFVLHGIGLIHKQRQTPWRRGREFLHQIQRNTNQTGVRHLPNFSSLRDGFFTIVVLDYPNSVCFKNEVEADTGGTIL